MKSTHNGCRFANDVWLAKDLVTAEAILITVISWPFWLQWSHCHVQNTGLKCPGLCYVTAYLLEIAIGSSSTVLMGEIVTHHTRQHFFQSSAVQLWSPWVNYGLRFLFLAFRKGSRCGLRCCRPSVLGVDRDEFRDSAGLNWTEWSLEFRLPLFVTILLGRLAPAGHFHPESSLSLNIFSFSDRRLSTPDMVVYKNVSWSEGCWNTPQPQPCCV